ncbi:hypothetical protein [Phytohabitans suffuscus]|uniref:Uncharacterized protein n=1 Tax=Phytohabitans suffuscus TaxID=624315 RepID=A0A6F8YTI6_9ACTN|nr:hypothetical protein [Phytohabitans suffuscus]BCB89293.1 hypothetical protein Psuf_066060 [Phytohabitans suffuscus]
MDASSVPGYVGMVLYGIDFVPDLSDDDAIRWRADSMINQRHFADSPAVYAAAIKAVLAAGRLPRRTLDMSTRYSEKELLDFLRRLDRHLDGLRPWPRPAFRKLDVQHWSQFTHARAIARVDESIHQLTGRLNQRFDEVEINRQTRPVAVIELRSGHLVALLGPAGRPKTTFTLLQHDTTDPAEIIARFCEYTELPPERITRTAEP